MHGLWRDAQCGVIRTNPKDSSERLAVAKGPSLGLTDGHKGHNVFRNGAKRIYMATNSFIGVSVAVHVSDDDLDLLRDPPYFLKNCFSAILLPRGQGEGIGNLYFCLGFLTSALHSSSQKGQQQVRI